MLAISPLHLTAARKRAEAQFAALGAHSPPSARQEDAFAVPAETVAAKAAQVRRGLRGFAPRTLSLPRLGGA